MKDVIGISTEVQRSRTSHHTLGNYNLSSHGQAAVEVAEVAVCVVRVRSFELLWRKLIHWWSVWWSDFLTEQGMTRLAASPAFQHTACVKLTQQNKAKFAFNMALTIWGELLLYPGWSVVASMRFVSRRSIRISLSLITPPFSAAAWGKEEP